VLERGYINLDVTVDGKSVAHSVTIIVDTAHILRAVCERLLIRALKVEKQVYCSCPAVGDDGTIYVSTGLLSVPATIGTTAVLSYSEARPPQSSRGGMHL
jgi:hypothetical protein